MPRLRLPSAAPALRLQSLSSLPWSFLLQCCFVCRECISSTRYPATDSRRELGARAPGPAASALTSEPTPSMVISTVDPSLIDPTPTDVPQAITSPGNSDISWEIRLTCAAGEKIMSESA